MAPAPFAGSQKPVQRRTPGRPNQEKAGALREIYLQVALQTFLRHGYAGSSMEEIARRAKASKVTLYRRFGDKAGLFRLALHHAIGKVRKKLSKALGNVGRWLRTSYLDSLVLKN